MNTIIYSSVVDFKSQTIYALKLVIISANINEIKNSLENHLSKCPGFFDNELVILDATKIHDEINWDQLIQLLKKNNLNMIGFNAVDQNYRNAISAGLTHIKTSDHYFHDRLIKTNEYKDKNLLGNQKTLIINKPLRSGQKIYAQKSDLVIIGMVSQGAEVVSDGNIHVYGPLRGKAIAGAKGNISSCIFTTQLNAELLSIAGIYNIIESKLNRNIQNKPALIRLNKETLSIEPLEI